MNPLFRSGRVPVPEANQHRRVFAARAAFPCGQPFSDALIRPTALVRLGGSVQEESHPDVIGPAAVRLKEFLPEPAFHGKAVLPVKLDGDRVR